MAERDFKSLLSDGKAYRSIHTIVILASFWESLAPLQDRAIRALRQHMALYGRILVVGRAPLRDDTSREVTVSQAETMADPFFGQESPSMALCVTPVHCGTFR